MGSVPLAALTVKPPEQPDLLGSVGKALSIKGMMQQQQDADLQLQEHRRSIAEDDQIRAAIGNAGGVEQALPEIMKVSPTKGLAIQKNLTEWKAADTTQKLNTLKLHGEKLATLGQIAGSITDQPTYEAGLDQALQSQAIDQPTYNRLKAVPFDPTTVKQWQTQSLAAKDQLDAKQKELELKFKEEKQKADVAHNKEMELPEIVRQRKSDYAAFTAANPDKAKNAKTEYEFNNRWDTNHAALLRASRAAALAPPEASTDTLATNPESQSILAQTGLSLPAFLAVTGQASQLPRDAATRTKAFADVQKWANARGIDTSTLTSQYKAANETLQKNIERNNSTRILEDELQGTVDNLRSTVKDDDLGKLRIGNVLKVWAGQEVNDDLAQQYAQYLGQLRNELAGYYAATQGRTGAAVNDSDKREAELIIKNGIAGKSLDGLQKSIAASTDKMAGVMQRSVDSSRKQVWNLFGVGDKFKGSADQAKPAAAAAKTLTMAQIQQAAKDHGVSVDEAKRQAAAQGYEVK